MWIGGAACWFVPMMVYFYTHHTGRHSFVWDPVVHRDVKGLQASRSHLCKLWYSLDPITRGLT